MEKKTIGGFIAALRKANGMTQKDLAERLNVSDKSVSRWERDDSAPDLSLIPVIAEIFDVTCDELLRGERKPASERSEPTAENATTPKGEKQRQRILAASLFKFKTRSFIAMGIAGAGLIAAMICNLAFLRANLGFMAAAVFYLASIICQTIFINGAFFSVADDGLDDAEVGQYKHSVIRLAERSFGLTVVLLGVTLPLIVFVDDPYLGLSAGSWAGYGLIYGLLAFLVVGVVCHFVNASLLNRGVYSLSEKESRAYWPNKKLKRKCAAVLLVIAGITLLGQFVINEISGPTLFVSGTTFEDYESFVAYMEQDTPPTPYDLFDENSIIVTPVPDGVHTYYDEFGNEISEEEALHRTLEDKNGNVVCEYMARNESAISVRYTAGDGTVLPITVFTQDDYRVGWARLNIVNIIFVVAYCLESAIVLAVYFKKRTK